MTADLLRRAAAKIRENATGPFVTSSPWGRAVTDDMGFAVHRGAHDTVALYASRGDAAHIASWHPDVALTVADLLDFAAEAFFADVRAASNIERIAGMPMPARCIAVARAYLGEDA